MKFLIKWLCFLYFSVHEDTTGLLFHDEDFGSLRIKFEQKGTENVIKES